MADISPETYKQYTEELNANHDFQYLKDYEFQGFINTVGKSWKDFLTNYFFDTTLFRHESSAPLTVDQMVNYTVSYMACVTAVDLFAKKCKDTDYLFQGKQAKYRLKFSTYTSAYDYICLTFETADAMVRQVFSWIINIQCMDYKMVASPLDRRIEITGAGFGDRHLGYTGLCKDTTLDLIEDLIQRMEY